MQNDKRNNRYRKKREIEMRPVSYGGLMYFATRCTSYGMLEVKLFFVWYVVEVEVIGSKYFIYSSLSIQLYPLNYLRHQILDPYDQASIFNHKLPLAESKGSFQSTRFLVFHNMSVVEEVSMARMSKMKFLGGFT